MRAFSGASLAKIVCAGVVFFAVQASAQTDGVPADAVPDFSGYWQRSANAEGRMFHPPVSGPGPVMRADDAGAYSIGDHTNPILQPHTAAAVKAFGDSGRAGHVELPAWALCWPSGVPLVLNMAEPLQFLQTPDEVTMFYQRDQQIRRIHMNQEHPENLAPSWYGYSVGHYEGGDTLVIDTRGHNDRAVMDRFGTPRSESLRIIERYTIAPDRQSLNVEFTIEDPQTFTTPWSATLTYWRFTGPVFERICAENNKNPDGGFFAIPIDEEPDF
ncbi:MAG: hypothetical protein IID54_01075 [Proteobacteria bacterium]|nr:hypothetical protein [Pseudomonadota bacterium]